MEVVEPGEEEAQGGLYRSLQLPERRLYRGGCYRIIDWKRPLRSSSPTVDLFSQVIVIGQEEMASSCARGGFGWILGKISSLKVSQALEQAAQGSG